MRVVDLPFTEEEDLVSAAELQAEKISPFPLERMVVAYEVLEQKEDASRVLIVTAQEDFIRDLGQQFLHAGCTPRWIDIDIMAWWYLLKTEGHILEQGGHTTLLLDNDNVHLLVALDGIPVLFRSLGLRYSLDEQQTAVELAHEVNYTLTTLEAEWGATSMLRLTVWSHEEPGSSLLHHLEEVCESEIEAQRFESLPPLSQGLAFRISAQGASSLNLTDHEWLQKEEDKKVRVGFYKATALLIGVWLILASSFWGICRMQENSLESAKMRVKEYEAPADEVRRIRKKVSELEHYADRTFSAIECLREISSLLPQGVDLTSFVYKKASDVNLRGSAKPNNVNQIYEFFEKLEATTLFTSVLNEKITTRTHRGRRMAQFRVTIKLPEGKI